MANQSEMRDRMSSVEGQLQQLAASMELITAQLQSLQVNLAPAPALPEIVVPKLANKALIGEDDMLGLEDDPFQINVENAKLVNIPKTEQDERFAKLEEKLKQFQESQSSLPFDLSGVVTSSSSLANKTISISFGAWILSRRISQSLAQPDSIVQILFKAKSDYMMEPISQSALQASSCPPDAAAAHGLQALAAESQALAPPPVPSPSSSSSSSYSSASSSRVRFRGAYGLHFSCARSRAGSRMNPSCLKANGVPHRPHSSIPRPVQLEGPVGRGIETPLKVLKMRLEELGIDMQTCLPGQYHSLLCPSKYFLLQRLLLLPVFVSGFCSVDMFQGSCGWKGTRLVAYFAERLISAETLLRRNAVMQKKCENQILVMHDSINNDPAFDIYTNFQKAELNNCYCILLIGVKESLSVQVSGREEKFWQEAHTEKIFYGLDDIKGKSEIIIVEGEMDKLAMEEAGFRNCVSVPDGAPPSTSDKDLPPEGQDIKYQYLWNCKDYLKEASRIILATDGDKPGQALAEELARRLGRERCWRVKWPKKNDSEYFKDANEVLMYVGPGVLREVIDDAELYPIRGLFTFKDFFDEINGYYHRTLGYEFGVSTGWKSLNHLYNVVPGELTIVTGVPNSGKSEWIDALLCNINESVGWKFALCSMENRVREHARKLLEKHIKKPFFDSKYGEPAERMGVEDFERGKRWLSDTFYLIRCEDDSLPSIKWVLDLAKSAVLRHGVRGLVIDPYNELDHQRPSGQTETEYVSQMLTLIRRFAQHHSCHVWFVAHPRQLHNWVGEPPNLYDISGSAHFINKCDNGIVIHRNRDPEAGPVDQVQVCVRKVRNKVAGTIGDAFLNYNRVTGEFIDLDAAPKKK
ncbi:twinkle homolog protein, chloroplastic/mitochondrial-like [Eucalyptus grandis]|uniref:twinkle homolog protein, chloroplastic/mitochondrial-like n=1 Tax=Eucalyptus grandis TaxID=71139 RepID=UPI00192EA52C|nr:twinkle homolog protein, chloroplastic/mitochondrial-like [Eucalyptus grandis]